MTPLRSADVALLREAALRFGPPARAAKAALLDGLAQRALAGPRILEGFHDTLLFVAAYADDEGIAALAERALARCARAAQALAASGRGPGDGGIAWSEVTACVTYDLARWLARRFPGRAELTSFGEGGARLPALLALLLPAVEADAIAAAGDAPLPLLDALKGARATRLAFLVDALERLPAAPPLRAHLYDALDAFVTIAPEGGPASRTFLRGLPAPLHAQDGPLAKSVAEPRALLETPLPPACALCDDAREALVDTARATLAMLARETDPVTWPATDAVSLHALDGGLAVALYPMHPTRRPAFDSHTGYVAFRNRVPIAYGGGWPFLGTCRIGINVFPAFRGGESALAFAQVLRVYRQHFGVTRFVVEPYQFGAGNAEGLRSGAFWFYWRLGFRPTDAALARLAGREAARLARQRGTRTPLALMRELAGGDLALDVAPLPAALAVDAGDLAVAVSRHIVRSHGGDRDAAQRAALAQVRAALDVRDDGGWPPGERAAFASLALALACVADLATWRDAEKAACVALMRAKGAADDAPYFRALAGHARLPAALLAIVRAAR